MLPYVLAVIGLLILLMSFFVVKQQTAVVIQRFGKFNSIRKAGLQMKIPLIDQKAATLSLRIQELDVMVETKTKSNSWNWSNLSHIDLQSSEQL